MSDREKIENKTVELKDHEVASLASLITWMLHSTNDNLPSNLRIQIVNAIKQWQGMNDR